MHSDAHRQSLAAGSMPALHKLVQTTPVHAGWPDSPILRLKELIKLLQVSRSKAYELMKTDPDFPKGIPLYDCELSPKFYWTHEAISWLDGRAEKFRNRQKEN